MPDQRVAELRVEDDFAYLLRLLPEGWQKQAKELGALTRCRKVADAESLLRVLLIHLAEGCSLRETALRVRRAQIANLSDVAIMDRLRLAGEWFRWMNTELIKTWAWRQPQLLSHFERPVRLVDATRVAEPGPTGSSWVVHYCIDLRSLSCQQIILTDYHSNGESFERFSPQPQELYIADRVYGARPGIFSFGPGPSRSAGALHFTQSAFARARRAASGFVAPSAKTKSRRTGGLASGTAV